MNLGKRKIRIKANSRSHSGFTIPELLIASLLLIIICVGVLEAYVYAIKINRGNNMRMQALSVLQQEVEYYRSLKFIPVGSDAAMNAGAYTRPPRTSADGQVFSISVTVENIPSGADSTATFKQITITAVPQVMQTEGWLQDLNTTVAVQRVRAN